MIFFVEKKKFNGILGSSTDLEMEYGYIKYVRSRDADLFRIQLALCYYKDDPHQKSGGEKLYFPFAGDSRLYFRLSLQIDRTV